MPRTRAQLNAALRPTAIRQAGSTGTENEVVVLNGSGLKLRTRTSKRTGKKNQRVTVNIDSEPLLHVFNDTLLSQKPADAMAEVIKKNIEGVTESVTVATLDFRIKAQRAMGRSANWAVKRYRGGRLKGDFEPGRVSETRKFNDSGRLVASIVARQNRKESGYTVNVAANRLDPREFRDLGTFVTMVDDLQRLVPELGSGEAMAKNPRVAREISASIADMIQKARLTNVEKQAQLERAILRLVLGRFARTLGL